MQTKLRKLRVVMESDTVAEYKNLNVCMPNEKKHSIKIKP